MPTTKQGVNVQLSDGSSARQTYSVDIDGNYVVGTGGGGGGAVSVSDGADAAQGFTTDAAVVAGAAGTVSAKLRAISRDMGATSTNTAGLLTLAGFQARVPAPGQAAMAASMPVVVASNQSAIPVSGAVTAVVTAVDGGIASIGAAADTGASTTLMGRLLSLIAKFPTSLGQKTAANSLGVVLASDQPAIPVTGAGGGTQYADGTAAATPTGTQLNWNEAGTQRAASTAKPLPVQMAAAIAAGANRIGKITLRNAADSADIDPLAEATFTARHPVVGQALMAASMPVVLPSNQAAIPVNSTVVAALPAGDNNIGNVDIVTLPALPAGTAAIGKLAANAGVNIGTVDVATMPSVTIGTLGAGSAVIGKVSTDQSVPGTTDRVTGATTWRIDLTPTLQNFNTLFTVGDYVGPTGGNAWAINPINRGAGMGGQVTGIMLIDAEGLLTSADIYIFDNSNIQTSLPAGNAPWSLSDAAAKYCIDFVSVIDWKSYGNGTMGHATFPSGPISYQANGQTIYFAVVTQNAMTYAGATPLTMKVSGVMD